MIALNGSTDEGRELEFNGSELATKNDVATAFADLKVDIVRWLIITQLALGGFIFAALRLIK